jgi:hypothetical protein
MLSDDHLTEAENAAKQVITEHWAEIAAVAYQGYQESGRGFVTLHFAHSAQSKAVEPEPLRFRPVSAVDGDWPNHDARHLTLEYDPETQIVLVMDFGVVVTAVIAGGDEVLTPPQAYFQLKHHL